MTDTVTPNERLPASGVRGTGVSDRAFPRQGERALFGRVMALVAVTVGWSALGAYLGRHLSGGVGIIFFIGALACVFGLNAASHRGNEQLAVGLLFGLGALLGLAIAPVLAGYAKSDPASVWDAAGATAVFVAGLSAIGYSTRRDLSSWARGLTWALLALIIAGLVLLLVSIPQANMVYALIGLVIFGGFTIVDFNRLRHADGNSAVPIAAGIFLDIFNIFLFFLELFGGERES